MKLLLTLFSLGMVASEAITESKLILYGVNGRPAVEIGAIPPSNGPSLPEQGVKYTNNRL
jgi:hypothetical protein